MTELSIKELHEKLVKKEITSESLVKEALEKAHKYQEEFNPFVSILDDAKETEVNDNLLSGIPVAIKDNFSTEGILSTGSSNTLNNYVPFFDATVVKKLKEVGAVNIGKTVLDELGMGGTGTTGHTGTVRNPWDKARMTGGSSAGSACAVSLGIVPAALGSDTGDSIRKPASLCGIVGFKPTWGLISRYGLFPFACSLDHVGVLTRSVEDAAIVVDAIKGKDENDMTSLSETPSLLSAINNDVKGKKLFYIKEIADINTYTNPSDEVKSTLKDFMELIEKIKKLGIEVEEVSFNQNLLNAIYPTYICISCAEATSNFSNLTGIIFGPRGKGSSIEEIMMDHRTNGFSPLIKRRFVIGSYVLQRENQERYYLNACRVRRMIIDEMNKLFEKYDGLILPASGKGASSLDGEHDVISKEAQVLENHLAIGNFGGYPSITIPFTFTNGLPVGVNITGKVKDDANVLNIASAIENVLEFKGQIGKGAK